MSVSRGAFSRGCQPLYLGPAFIQCDLILSNHITRPYVHARSRSIVAGGPEFWETRLFTPAHWVKLFLKSIGRELWHVGSWFSWPEREPALPAWRGGTSHHWVKFLRQLFKDQNIPVWGNSQNSIKPRWRGSEMQVLKVVWNQRDESSCQRPGESGSLLTIVNPLQENWEMDISEHLQSGGDCFWASRCPSLLHGHSCPFYPQTGYMCSFQICNGSEVHWYF